MNRGFTTAGVGLWLNDTQRWHKIWLFRVFHAYTVTKLSYHTVVQITQLHVSRLGTCPRERSTDQAWWRAVCIGCYWGRVSCWRAKKATRRGHLIMNIVPWEKLTTALVVTWTSVWCRPGFLWCGERMRMPVCVRSCIDVPVVPVNVRPVWTHHSIRTLRNPRRGSMWSRNDLLGWMHTGGQRRRFTAWRRRFLYPRRTSTVWCIKL
mmetsp:Transcript_12836/g.22496  ORF Transcript_12836/g.22496 Transcript_12836/m.22496 type:complete len:207 (+) Transcript_12836:3395-4015(+)